MKPPRSPLYLAWIRTLPCVVCGSTGWIEASHTGPHGLGQKSSDYSAIPLCIKHHRTGSDSYHRLGPRRFSEVHNLDIRAIVARLNLKPQVRLEADCFVAHLKGERYVLGKISSGFPPALPGCGKCAGGSAWPLPRLREAKRMSLVSYSFQEPAWPPVCECKYDEVHDTVDREDCLLHCYIVEEIALGLEDQITIKKPATIAKRDKENAA